MAYNKVNICEKMIKSSTFASSELIDLLASHDTLVKKITCGYLIDKSSLDSNLSLLTANILLRDCCDANPAIRSASLLALSSLPDMEEAAVSAVSKAFADSSPQVRRVAPHCCVNIYRHSSEICLNNGLVDLLYEGIRDSDPIAISNCLLALENILSKEGGLVMNKNIAHHLVEKITLFSDCNIVYVLNVLKKYSPKKEDDIYFILNELDPFLTSSSPSVLLSAAQLFLNLIKVTEHLNLTLDLANTLKVPFCKIMNQNRPELCYFLVKFLRNSTANFRGCFCNHYKYFLVKTKDPYYLKEKKFDILANVAAKETLKDIVSEVNHYTSDFQNHKNAFKCLGILGSYNKDSEEEVVSILSQVIQTANDQVVEAAFECLLFILLKKKELDREITSICSSKFSDHLYSNVSLALARPGIQESNPQLVMNVLNFVVPFLDNIQDILEDLWKQFSTWDITTQCLFISTACISFLHWPSIVQPIMSTILSKALKSPVMDLSSHAAFVYAALEEGPLEAFSVLSISKYYPLSSSLQILKNPKEH